MEGLRLHPGSGVVAEYGCWAVVVLGSSTAGKEALVQVGACAAVYGALKAHPRSVKVVEKAAWAARNLISPGEWEAHRGELERVGLGVLLKGCLEGLLGVGGDGDGSGGEGGGGGLTAEGQEDLEDTIRLLA